MVLRLGHVPGAHLAIADHVAAELRHSGIELLGVEGADIGEWVLVDAGNVIVHVMQDETRALYQLEKLWSGQFTEAAA